MDNPMDQSVDHQTTMDNTEDAPVGVTPLLPPPPPDPCKCLLPTVSVPFLILRSHPLGHSWP